MSLARTVGTSLSVAAAIALAAYPLLAYAIVGRFGASGLAALLAAACLARLAVLRLGGRPSFGGGYLAAVCVGGIVLAAASFWLDDGDAVRYYPVLVNAALLVVFAASLVHPPSLVERIARWRDPGLPPAAVAYTRRVTAVWTAFFALNGAAALYTAVAATFETWVLYNGLIAYLLIGALFAAELAVRARFKRRLEP